MKRRILLSTASIVCAIVLWELVRQAFRLEELVMPSLGSIWVALLSEPLLATHVWTTLSEALAGFIFGNLLSIIFSILILRWSALETAVMPYAIAVKTTPIVAIAPILFIWLGGGWLSKAVAAAMVCFFPTLVNLVRGLRFVDSDDYREYVDLFKNWGASWWDSLFYLRAPFALPYVFSALKVSSSLALVGAMVGEFIAADKGLGFLVVIHSRRLETPEMLAAVLLCALIGVAWFAVIVVIERLFSRRFGSLTRGGELL